MKAPIFRIALALIGLLLAAGCAAPTPTSRPSPTAGRCGFGGCGNSIPAQLTAQARSDAIETRCGDGICQKPETAALCPQDCQAPVGRMGVVVEIDQAKYYSGSEDECWNSEALQASAAAAFSEAVNPDSAAPGAFLYFTIVVQIEPHDSYWKEALYRRDAERLRRVAQIAAAHGGRVTVQTQPPFLEMAAALKDPIHQDLSALRNEIALRFDEDVVIGEENIGTLPVEAYTRELNALVERIEAVTGERARTWSGADGCIQLWEAAQQAGLQVNTCYKDPRIQPFDPGFAVVNPWRPAGAANVSARLAHDPSSPVIYIPCGVFPAHCDAPEALPHPYNYAAFDYVNRALRASLDASSPGMVNSFYITCHPGDFLEPEDDEQEYAVWDAWFTQVIDPLAASGYLQWATIAEMADAFEAWEAATLPGGEE